MTPPTKHDIRDMLRDEARALAIDLADEVRRLTEENRRLDRKAEAQASVIERHSHDLSDANGRLDELRHALKVERYRVDQALGVTQPDDDSTLRWTMP